MKGKASWPCGWVVSRLLNKKGTIKNQRSAMLKKLTLLGEYLGFGNALKEQLGQ